MNLKRRVDALEKPSAFYTIGELLDALDGVPLPPCKAVSLATTRALDAMEEVWAA